jgi:catechol-2,3-dioxygenase
MPALPSSNPAQFVQGAPVLHVADVETTAAFYREVLGVTWVAETRDMRWCGATTPQFTS